VRPHTSAGPPRTLDQAVDSVCFVVWCVREGNLLVKNATLWTVDAANTVMSGVDILMAAGVITSIGRCVEP
jgi:hypothetical protein